MDLYLQGREGTPEGENLKQFISFIREQDPNAKIQDKSMGPFLAFWVESDILSGYFSTSITPYINIRNKETNSDFFGLAIIGSLSLTIYQI